MIKLICPKCGGEAKLALADGDYSGPRRCWKCHEYFTITIVNNKVVSCEPLSEEEYEIQVAAKKGLPPPQAGAKREEPDIPRLVPERNRDYSRPMSSGEPAHKEEPVKQPSLFPEGGFRTFEPTGADYKAPGKSSAPEKISEKPKEFIRPPGSQAPSTKSESGKDGVYPPERFRTFVPMEETDEEPPKPKKPKEPPEKFNFFIPPAT